ncbi:M3 family oligoendopeptidase [Sphingomonas hankyongi]|uniref:Oligoendopeptidase F family protein n=1 Tax=Sphingomonas hankyongi TaxID=2908209 RepID=A0ABT0S0K7_9SPHN|nr:M3 family oligoendopeptidase [Sphingomonas hankyongi]MCL6729404.1 oligoendopeptidase F family protein [Sphingomonas hankyongi]
MLDLSRREILATAAVATAVSVAAPARAFAQTAAGGGSTAAAWDLADLYPSDAAWETERQALLKAIPSLKTHKGTLGRGASTMRAVLDAQSEINKRTSRLYTYASLKADEDLRVSPNQERKSQAQDVFTALGEATAWTNPEIVALGGAKVNEFIKADPGLGKFAFYLRDVIRTSAHTLSPDEEALLASANTPLAGPQDIRDQLAASDIPRPTVKLSDGKEIRLDDQGYTLARGALDRNDRKNVFDKFWGSYKAFENTLGTALAAKVNGDKFTAKARKYDSALQAALDGSNLPEAVYRSLIAETNRGLPVLHRYFELRRRMLGLSDMGYWDIYPPLVKSDRSYSLAEMRQLTIDAIKPLGPDYGRIFADASAKRWMDPLPRQGKASGAYMQPGAYDVHPYLLLNLSDKYDGLTTYAHEWGHAMHTLLANAAQPYELSNYPTFTAEVASTAHELLLANMMVERAKSKEEKLFYLGQIMENYRGTFFRQAMFAEFQLAINDLANKGEALSGEKMSALYFDLLKRYHGPKVMLEPVYSAEWMYIQHFFFGFYVWQYATSITAANYFAQKVMHGTPADRDRYLGVLRAGGSDYGYNLLKGGGLDMATAEPYRLIVDSFSKVLDQAEALV